MNKGGRKKKKEKKNPAYSRLALSLRLKFSAVGLITASEVDLPYPLD